MKKLTILFISALAAFNVQAADEDSKKGVIDAKQIYFGGGIGLNDANGNDATGFQFFAGLPIPVEMGKAKLSGEIGYMDSGDFDTPGVTIPGFGTIGGGSFSATGLWGTAVVEVPIGEKMDLIGRIGLDIGDDDGVMIGGGIGIALGPKMDIRFEYVIRDNIDSLQANIVIRQ